VLIWVAEDSLSPDADELIRQRADEVFVSAATIWEVEIKRAIGRLKAPDDLIERVDDSGFERLTVTFEHALAAGRLPRHHGDPFDRMLVAQAQLDGLTLATSDPQLAAYGVSIERIARRRR
jgi:PIN domain nuclease of toxin-antitoxin system